MARKVDLAFVPLAGPILGMIQTGRIKAIAIASAKRHPLLPDHACTPATVWAASNSSAVSNSHCGTATLAAGAARQDKRFSVSGEGAEAQLEIYGWHFGPQKSRCPSRLRGIEPWGSVRRPCFAPARAGHASLPAPRSAGSMPHRKSDALSERVRNSYSWRQQMRPGDRVAHAMWRRR